MFSELCNGFKWDGDRETHARNEVSGIQQTENCSKLLTAAHAIGVHVYMTVEEFVAIDDNIAIESMGDWEDDLVRSYVDDDVIILPEPVLTIREAYPIALSLQRLQEDELTPIGEDLT